MNRPFVFRTALCTALLPLICCLALGAEPSVEDVEFFERQVRPILVETCQKCHGDRKQEGGLRLDTRDAVLKGGDNGAAIEPGKPDASLLVEAVGYTGDIKMPPRGRLADDRIAALAEWVRRGAPWPSEKAGADKPGEFNLAERKAKQWAFRPVRGATPLAVKNAAWPRTAVDHFVLAKLDEAGLAPAAAADKRTLLRRVTFDLIGLPPSPDDIDSFLADDSPQAFERVVDRLLDSPHFGERWSRHWLDLVRFAETHGHEFDFEMPLAFEYRDYVIRALNADVPYDQFVVEHVAGDLLTPPRRHPTERFNESIIGTGFWYLGEATHSPVDVRADEATRVDNQIDVFAKTFLAQTLACARCHDHKFDAISTKDYYALAGYLQSSRYDVACVDPPEERAEIVKKLQGLEREESRLLRTAAAESARAIGARVADCLLAALRSGREGSSEATAAAKKFGIDPAEVSKWVGHLQGPALKDPDDPFHFWALLAARPGELTTEAVKAFVREQVTAETALSARVVEQAPRFVVFEDFSSGNFDDWFVSGEAFGSEPIDVRALSTGSNPTPAAAVGARIAHSGRLASRLEGTLRSRTFTIDKNRVLYHAAGKATKINLIIDSYQLIRNPIYGGLTIALDKPDQMQWYAQDVGKWVGHNAYIELIDPGEGFLALDRVLFADEGPPADGPGAVSRRILEEQNLDSPVKIANTYALLVEESLTKWNSGKPQATAKPDVAQSCLLHWLLSNNLDKTLPRSLAVSRPDLQTKLTEFANTKSQLESAIRYNRKVMAMTDGTPEDDRVHLRGSPHKLGDVVPRRFLEALAGPDQPPPAKGSGRLDLARRIVDPANPLLARVFVNRLWQHHFGEGLVRTPDDFGNMGQPPTHPELLDFLTGEFVKNGWSIKKLHRLLVLSKTYQMASMASDPRADEVDPQNKLWHRMNLRRLEAEAIRDSILAVSGRLDDKMYGPGVMPYLTPFMVGRGRPGGSGPLDGDGRRTLYLNVRRNFLFPMLLAFDYPIPFSTIGRRSVSNVPAQALALMNNPFVLLQAEVWARRVLAQHSDPGERVRAMYLAAFARPPTAAEEENALTFLAEQSRQYPAGDVLRPWADLAHVLFNVKEFIFID
jgi:hypothetical protein